MRSDLLPILAAIPFLVGPCGCTIQRTVLENSAVDINADYDSELDFWDDLATRSVVTNDDALHSLLLVVNDEVTEGYEARIAQARQRGWISSTADLPKDESAAVGMISVATCDILDITGGVTMQLLGPSPRYCAKELVYIEMIPLRSENQALTGLEFVDLIGRIEDAMPAPEAPIEDASEEPSEETGEG